MHRVWPSLFHQPDPHRAPLFLLVSSDDTPNPTADQPPVSRTSNPPERRITRSKTVNASIKITTEPPERVLQIPPPTAFDEPEKNTTAVTKSPRRLHNADKDRELHKLLNLSPKVPLAQNHGHPLTLKRLFTDHYSSRESKSGKKAKMESMENLEPSSKMPSPSSKSETKRKGGKRGSIRNNSEPVKERARVTKKAAPKSWLAYKGTKYEDPEYFDDDIIVIKICSTLRERLGENLPVFLAKSDGIVKPDGGEKTDNGEVEEEEGILSHEKIVFLKLPGGAVNPVPDQNNLSSIIAGLKGGRVRVGSRMDTGFAVATSKDMAPLKEISLDKATKQNRAIQEKNSATCNFAGTLFGIPGTIPEPPNNLKKIEVSALKVIGEFLDTMNGQDPPQSHPPPSSPPPPPSLTIPKRPLQAVDYNVLDPFNGLHAQATLIADPAWKLLKISDLLMRDLEKFYADNSYTPSPELDSYNAPPEPPPDLSDGIESLDTDERTDAVCPLTWVRRPEDVDLETVLEAASSPSVGIDNQEAESCLISGSQTSSSPKGCKESQGDYGHEEEPRTNAVVTFENLNIASGYSSDSDKTNLLQDGMDDVDEERVDGGLVDEGAVDERPANERPVDKGLVDEGPVDAGPVDDPAAGSVPAYPRLVKAASGGQATMDSHGQSMRSGSIDGTTKFRGSMAGANEALNKEAHVSTPQHSLTGPQSRGPVLTGSASAGATVLGAMGPLVSLPKPTVPHGPGIVQHTPHTPARPSDHYNANIHMSTAIIGGHGGAAGVQALDDGTVDSRSVYVRPGDSNPVDVRTANTESLARHPSKTTFLDSWPVHRTPMQNRSHEADGCPTATPAPRTQKRPCSHFQPTIIDKKPEAVEITASLNAHNRNQAISSMAGIGSEPSSTIPYNGSSNSSSLANEPYNSATHPTREPPPIPTPQKSNKSGYRCPEETQDEREGRLRALVRALQKRPYRQSPKREDSRMGPPSLSPTRPPTSYKRTKRPSPPEAGATELEPAGTSGSTSSRPDLKATSNSLHPGYTSPPDLSSPTPLPAPSPPATPTTLLRHHFPPSTPPNLNTAPPYPNDSPAQASPTSFISTLKPNPRANCFSWTPPKSFSVLIPAPPCLRQGSITEGAEWKVPRKVPVVKTASEQRINVADSITGRADGGAD